MARIQYATQRQRQRMFSAFPESWLWLPHIGYMWYSLFFTPPSLQAVLINSSGPLADASHSFHLTS